MIYSSIQINFPSIFAWPIPSFWRFDGIDGLDRISLLINKSLTMLFGEM
jgi:hypothetical protein